MGRTCISYQGPLHDQALPCHVSVARTLPVYIKSFAHLAQIQCGWNNSRLVLGQK